MDYDRRIARGRLKVLEEHPTKLSYNHPSGTVTITHTDGQWIAVDARHKIHKLRLTVGPKHILKPAAQRIVIEQIDSLLG